MMSSTVALLAGSVFVGLACCNVVLMCEAGRTQSVEMKNRLVLLHRPRRRAHHSYRPLSFGRGDDRIRELEAQAYAGCS